jgi:hypothetical protein
VSTATTSIGWWKRYSKPSDERGHTRMKARPTMRSSSMAEK